MRSGFTLVELAVTLAVVSVSGGLIAVSLSARGQSLEGNAQALRHGRMKAEETNAMNIVKALATYGVSNKDWYPGLSSRGQYLKDEFKGNQYAAAAIAKSVEEQRTGAGCTVGVDQAMAQAILLEESLVAPAQWFSPGEGDVDVKELEKKPGVAAKVEPCHSSYAMLAYGRPSLKAEWKATMNPQAVVFASRLIFGERQGQHHSLWTAEGSGQWRGVMARGDGSVEAVNAAGGERLGHLKYGGKVFQASGDTAAIVGIFGKHTDMANFEAEGKKAQLGSAMDGAKVEK